MKLNFVIPTFNEAENIELLIEKIQSVCENNNYTNTIFIIDDNSPDNTAEHARKFSNVNVVVRTDKRGLGSAYKDGFKLVEPDTDLVFMMDADLSHDPDEIPNFVNKMAEGYDVIQGSRKVKGGKIEDWGVSRYLISYGSSIITRPLTGLKDPNGTYKCFKPEFLNQVDYDSLSDGYGFGIELLTAFKNAKYKMVEIPIIFHKRFKGESKLTSAEVKRSWKLYVKLYKQKVFGKKKQKNTSNSTTLPQKQVL